MADPKETPNTPEWWEMQCQRLRDETDDTNRRFDALKTERNETIAALQAQVGSLSAERDSLKVLAASRREHLAALMSMLGPILQRMGTALDE